MKKICTLTDLCQNFKLEAPLYPFFDIRRVEDMVKSAIPHYTPFTHEFYAIWLDVQCSMNTANHVKVQNQLSFKTPYQVHRWEMKPYSKGWYIIFNKEFVTTNPSWRNFLVDFPFFRLDKSVPISMSNQDIMLAYTMFEKIFEEYHSDHADKFSFIHSYTQLLLLLTRRYFMQVSIADDDALASKTADIRLASGFLNLVETLVTQDGSDAKVRQPSYYAEQLNVHPNHLNAVVKRVSGKTTSQVIQHQLVNRARYLLQHSELTSKEIGFRLHFTEPTHFNAFFKKLTGVTPQQYREAVVL